MDRFDEKARGILDALAKEHGDETFVSSGYAYYDDAEKSIVEFARTVDAEARADEKAKREYHMNAINRLAVRIDAAGDDSDAVVEKAIRLVAELKDARAACLGWAHKHDKAESRIRLLEKMVDPAALRQGLENLGKYLGSPEAEEVRHWADRAEEAESRVADEHELYLSAHRDNMKGAFLLADMRARAEKVERLLAAANRGLDRLSGRLEAAESRERGLREALEEAHSLGLDGVLPSDERLNRWNAALSKESPNVP